MKPLTRDEATILMTIALYSFENWIGGTGYLVLLLISLLGRALRELKPL